MSRRATVAIALVGLLSACSGAPDNHLARYLRAAAGADEDRGWQYLGASRDSAYGGHRERYVAEAAAADWDAMQWSALPVVWEDDGVSKAEVWLESPPDTVPPFLIERGLVHGVCRGSRPGFGLGAYVLSPWFGQADMGGGGLNGSTMECNSKFIGDAAFELSPL